jgi:hypothetical protein
MVGQHTEIISVILINMWPQPQGRHVMIKYHYDRGGKCATIKISTHRLEACYLHWNDWYGIWLKYDHVQAKHMCWSFTHIWSWRIIGNVHNMWTNMQKGLRSLYVRIFYTIPLVEWYQTRVMYCRTMNVFCFSKYNMVILSSIYIVLN